MSFGTALYDALNPNTPEFELSKYPDIEEFDLSKIESFQLEPYNASLTNIKRRKTGSISNEELEQKLEQQYEDELEKELNKQSDEEDEFSNEEDEFSEEELEDDHINTIEILDYYNKSKNKRNDDDRFNQAQSQILLINSLIPCEKNTGIFDLNFSKLKQLMESQFFNYDLMRQIECTLHYLFSSISDLQTNIIIRRYFTKLVKLNVKSAHGSVYNTLFNNTNDLIILKTKNSLSDPDYYIIHEIFVGSILNLTRKDIPNFVYTYGGFVCSPPINPSANIFSYCKNTENTINYIMLENIKNSVTLHDYIESGSTISEFLIVYLQVLYALNYAKRNFDFTHYDLHASNVLIKTYDKRFSIPYTTEKGVEFILTDTIAYIIDYGLSHIVYENKNYGINGYEKYGVYYNSSYALYDAYRLLGSCLLVALTKNKKLFNDIKYIFRFFNITDEVEFAIIEQEKVNYMLPPIKIFPDKTIFDITTFIRDNTNINFKFISNNPGNPNILSCKGTDICLSSTQIISELSYSSEEPTDF